MRSLDGSGVTAFGCGIEMSRGRVEFRQKGREAKGGDKGTGSIKYIGAIVIY